MGELVLTVFSYIGMYLSVGLFFCFVMRKCQPLLDITLNIHKELFGREEAAVIILFWPFCFLRFMVAVVERIATGKWTE